MTTRTEPRVDVVVPVYNQLHVVRSCLESVLRWTDPEVDRVTIVADACDRRTTSFLREWCELYQGARLLENPRNLGFVRSCNRGLRASSAEIALLLNSDTWVTPRWTDKFVACMASDPRIGVASPLSNFAPHMQVLMLPGLDCLEMATRIEEAWDGEYPDVTTPEGFCFAIHRRCLAAVGYLDEAYDQGYGEESDFALRANYFGFRTVCATDTYIYHRGRASYSIKRRDELYRSSRQVFNDRWRNLYPLQVEEFRRRDPVAAVRWRLARSQDRTLEAAFKRTRSLRGTRPPGEPATVPKREAHGHRWRRADALRVLCILPTLNPYGGVVSVANHVNDLVEAGHQVKVLSMSRIRDDVLFLKTEPIFLPRDGSIQQLVSAEYDVLIATSWETVSYVHEAATLMPAAIPIYYVQDIEGDFFAGVDSEKQELALETYGMLPHLVVKTRYLETRLAEMGWSAHLIPPGLNLDLFYPREVARSPEKIVLGMARPGAPGDVRGFEVLRETYRSLRAERPDVRLAVFGSSELPDDFPYDIDFGRVGRDALPPIYSTADVFVDTSRVHGFGRCGVESMACGTACVLSDSGGVTEYAEDGVNAMIVPVGDPASTAASIGRLLDDDELRERLSRAGIRTVESLANPLATQALLDLIYHLRTARGPDNVSPGSAGGPDVTDRGVEATP